MTFKALRDLSPGYLSELITLYRPSCNLRSSKANVLAAPSFRAKTYGERAFAVAAPNLWNGLSATIRNTEPLLVFKCKVKLLLFNN